MTTNGNGNGSALVGTSTVKQGLAQMLKGGVIVSLKCCRESVENLESRTTIVSSFRPDNHSWFFRPLFGRAGISAQGLGFLVWLGVDAVTRNPRPC
jgi:hypothetical protein